MANILIVDDDEIICSLLRAMCSTMGHEVILTHLLKDGLKEITSHDYDLVLLDIHLPDGNGLEMLSRFRQAHSTPEIIILTAHGDSDGAELAINAGAWDYLSKPAKVGEMNLAISRALEFRKINREARPHVHLKRGSFIGESPQILLCLDLVAQAADSDANVLITGATGAGKEGIAAMVHKNSRRADRAFVVVDCSNLPENLIESVLFGHERGAFTGADKKKDGLIKEADGGTLFLDEVGELPFEMQKKMLRVLEERLFRPVGSVKESQSNFRLIAATNRDVDQMVRENRFREDLLFRLRTISVEVPPLRERKEDFMPLILFFMGRFHGQYGKGVKGISPDMLEAIQSYAWPGNVRELKNAMESAYLAAGRQPTLIPNHLPHEIRVKLKMELFQKEPLSEKKADLLEMPIDMERARKQLEQAYLSRLAQYCQGDIGKASTVSGLSRARLYELYRRNHLSLKPTAR
jgi:two-component system, NtrC family, response regulator